MPRGAGAWWGEGGMSEMGAGIEVVVVVVVGVGWNGAVCAWQGHGIG